MKFNEIIERDISNSEKVVAIAEIVAKARKAYGNDSIEIDSNNVNTVNGLVDIEFLSSDDKVAIATYEFNKIKMYAIEYCKSVPGSILDREIEYLIAINPILVNLLKESESSYI